jgi:hypothetical protein
VTQNFKVPPRRAPFKSFRALPSLRSQTPDWEVRTRSTLVPGPSHEILAQLEKERFAKQSGLSSSPDLDSESTRLCERGFKRQDTPGRRPLANIGIWTTGAWGFMNAPLAPDESGFAPCDTASLSGMRRFEDDLLLSSSWRLTHMLLAACRSSFRVRLKDNETLLARALGRCWDCPGPHIDRLSTSRLP